MAGKSLRLTILLTYAILHCSLLNAESLCKLFFEQIEKSPYFSLSGEPSSFGDELFLVGEYKLASIEYEREFFRTKDDEIKFRLGLSYVKSGEIDKGKRCFEELLLTDSPDIRFRAQELLGFLNIGSENIPSARFEFLDLRTREENPLSKIELSYWLGWTYLIDFDFANAEQEFSSVALERSYENKFYTSAYIIAREIKNRVNDFDYRSPRLARWLSMIVPGAGQIYVGQYKDGIISFAINGTLGYLTLSSLLSHKYFQSLVYFYFFFARYYFGSGDNAYKYAVEFNEKERASFVAELIKNHLVWQTE